MSSGNSRGLILKSNRTLGSQLVDRGLISLDDLEAANERFLNALRADDDTHVSLLHILLYDLQTLKESDLLNYQIEEQSLGYLRLNNYNIPPLLLQEFDISNYWATWTVPFDKEADTYFMATTYFLSPFVRQHWEEKLAPHTIIWYTTEFSELMQMLEQYESATGESSQDSMPAAAGGG